MVKFSGFRIRVLARKSDKFSLKFKLKTIMRRFDLKFLRALDEADFDLRN